MTNSVNYTWIENESQLAKLVEHWLSIEYIAIDTEFVRENTYYAQAGLIQIADPEAVYLIDPLEVQDLAALKPLLASEQVVKIIHAMSEDVDLLHHLCGTLTNRIFDTQVAAGFLNYGPALGYQNLVSTVLGYELDKSETRSDWLKRPLTRSQLDYAAKDAEHLIELYQALAKQLKEQNLYEAVLEEAQFIIDQLGDAESHPELAYLKLRGAWELSPVQQQRLQCLVFWRDQLAKTRNVPKPWVFGDHQLIQIAKRPPTKLGALSQIDKIKHKSIKLYGELLLQRLEDFKPQEQPNFEVIDPPIRGLELESYRKLKKVIQHESKESGIAAQFLGSRKMLERFVIHRYRKALPTLPREYMGWRRSIVGEKLDAALKD